MLKQYQLKNYKIRLCFFLIAISSLGILIIGSAKESVQGKQILGLVLGIIAMIVISLMDYSYVINFYWILYVINIGLLLLVQLIGDDAGGAVRWVEIAGIRFQPSELSKIILILFFAKFFTKYQEQINTVKILAASVILIGIPLALIKEQPDLSTSIVVALIFCILLFVAGLSYKIILSVFAIVIPMAALLISIILQPGQQIIEGYQAKRILAWLQPELYYDLVYQQTNSKIAIGSGQLFGKGLNNNIISSVKNGNFISEAQTDFIFAVAGEELGFIGGCVIIVLLALIAWECIRIGKNAKDLSGTLICCGMAALVTCQSFVNICVATGLMPNTGIPLPFISYGLTSLLSLFIGMGFVLNVGLQPKKY
ncbi:FtsW/RodA/SpoVE family cell cycle protein [Lachnotalea glycerini]|uniref:Rod shape-determining protein RodA n=1 Tax=Lachnotalea glycerini TaxID=1763509 RepID=A0A371JJE1_9FIRM|nr:FtsW/RodA/SpoVE family cell cycle protein [Lachnotalea glycerini]RDY32852.1 rod shape-determining protein RodA [Lachnotalea glycerini]